MNNKKNIIVKELENPMIEEYKTFCLLQVVHIHSISNDPLRLQFYVHLQIFAIY